MGVRGIIIFFMVYCKIFGFVSSDCGCDRDRDRDVFEDVKFRFYYGRNTTYSEYYLNEASDLPSHPMFRQNQSTILYIHGWNEKVTESDPLFDIVNAYLQRNEQNVLVLDYDELAVMDYETVVDNVPELGEKLALALIEMDGQGLDLTRLHLIGFSIGAHISAEIGRTTQRVVPFTLPRITGLDPAGPSYYDGINKELNKKDANFVDIIHSDAGIFGGSTSTGHADFWPNGGKRPQPICGSALLQFLLLIAGDHCAHDASVHYYADTVRAKKIIYLATNRVNRRITAQMGYNCPITARGDYDLKTQ